MTDIEILKSIVFYGFSLVIIVFAFLTIFTKNIIYSLLFSIVTFFTTAGIFFILGADFNAVIQISIYGIAIPILFAFAIMFTSNKENKNINLTLQPRFFITIASVSFLMLVLIYSILIALSLSANSSWVLTKQTMFINKFQMFAAISKGIYNNYLLGFELLAVFLLMAVVGLSTLYVIKEKKRG